MGDNDSDAVEKLLAELPQQDVARAWRACYRGVPEGVGDALWEMHRRSLALQAVAPGVAWGDLFERVAHALGLKNGRWGAVDVLDRRLGLGGRLVAQGEQREFCLEVWWSAFLLDLLARKVVRVVPGDVCPLVLVDYEALGVCTRR